MNAFLRRATVENKMTMAIYQFLPARWASNAISMRPTKCVIDFLDDPSAFGIEFIKTFQHNLYASPPISSSIKRSRIASISLSSIA